MLSALLARSVLFTIAHCGRRRRRKGRVGLRLRRGSGGGHAGCDLCRHVPRRDAGAYLDKVILPLAFADGKKAA